VCLVLLVMAADAASATALSTVRVAAELLRPVFATAPHGDRDRLFIVEQRGTIRTLDISVEPPVLQVAYYLDIQTSVHDNGNEQGLLGLAFHPQYASNGHFYVYYTASPGGLSRVARYSVSGGDPGDADESSAVVLMTLTQPQTNHNGGWIGFSPIDGYLYAAVGDGGNFCDTGGGHTATIGNGQDITNNLLGKMLRIDVDGDDFPGDTTRNYAIPRTNPFVGVASEEIWSYGLRNPYRASFDRETGDLYIGDVGQDEREEVDVQPAGEAGHNFGWRLREGTIQTPSVGGIAPGGALDPIFDYPHDDDGTAFVGSAVIGGVVYRGPLASLQGRYFFSDFITGRLWSMRFDLSASSQFDGSNFTDLTDHTLMGDPRFVPDVGNLDPISSFGEDAAGNLYFTKLGSSVDPLPDTGEIFRVPEPTPRALYIAAGLVLAVIKVRSRQTLTR